MAQVALAKGPVGRDTRGSLDPVKRASESVTAVKAPEKGVGSVSIDTTLSTRFFGVGPLVAGRIAEYRDLKAKIKNSNNVELEFALKDLESFVKAEPVGSENIQVAKSLIVQMNAAVKADPTLKSTEMKFLRGFTQAYPASKGN